MKNSLKNLMMATFVLLSTTIYAQIKNAKTETVKVYGNCGMCESKIEKAGSVNKIAKVDWNQETSMATITYDSKKTNQDEILKRIALVGYDSDKFLAPDDVYNNLHGCCQYDRVAKTPIKEEMKEDMKMASHDVHNNTEMKEEMKMETTPDAHNHSDMKKEMKMDSKSNDMKEEMKSKMEKKAVTKTAAVQKNANQLDAVYDNYFAVKDALVKTDGISASAKATALLSSLNGVQMNELKMDVNMVWMKVMKNLKADATLISKSTDAKKQRDSFDTLSENIYQLIKVSKAETPVYFQNCPMANDGKGANWLSKENNIKNPYYGSTMLSCGKTVETIK